MLRFYCPAQNITKEEIVILDAQELRHMKNALRLKPGDKINIFDGKGNEYRGNIKEINSKVVIRDIEAIICAVKNPRVKIAIACALPKHARMDEIIDKLTQLGVDRIIPLKTERVVVRLDKHKLALRQARWKKIALAAAKQSQRNILPVIENMQDIRQVLAAPGNYDLKLIPTLQGRRKSLKDVLLGAGYRNILVLIGPEGDFTGEEVSLCLNFGCIPVSLGDSVLRVETAAVAVASFIRFSNPF